MKLLRIMQPTLDRDKIMEIVANRELIEGVYNYCDRWCERCPMTIHCAVFVMEKAESNSYLSHDLGNEAFWQHIQNILKTASELLREMAQEIGVDFDALVSTEDEISRDYLNKEAEEHTLVQQAMQYMKMVKQWFESEELKTQLESPAAISKPEVTNLKDIEEVILWYYTLICVKITRAIEQDLSAWPASLEDMPGDSDGSVKVALISIDRSIASWWHMRRYFPQQKKQILEFLVCLDNLQRATEKAFPKARSFVRPGFDKQ